VESTLISVLEAAASRGERIVLRAGAAGVVLARGSRELSDDDRVETVGFRRLRCQGLEADGLVDESEPVMRRVRRSITSADGNVCDTGHSFLILEKFRRSRSARLEGKLS
jgi:hypothetical protein